MMSTAPAIPTYDPKALAVARAVAGAVDAEAVILFGSRARGDYHARSDVDILVVTADDAPDGKSCYHAAKQAASATAQAVYGELTGVDVLTMPASHFRYYRQSRNHVAGQAARQGVNMDGEPTGYVPGQYDRETDWPDINQRLLNTRRNLRTMTTLVASGADEEDIGMHAQQALENVLKGYISAIGAEYRAVHELEKLAAIVRRYPSENHISVAEGLHWLSKYAVEYKYGGLVEPIDDARELLEQVTGIVTEITARIHRLTGTSPDDVVNTRRRQR